MITTETNGLEKKLTLLLCVFLTLFHTEEEKRKKRQSADPASILEETIAPLYNRKKSLFSLCLSQLYIFTIFIPTLLMFLLPQAPHPSSLEYIIPSKRSNIKIWGEEERKRRELRGVKTKTVIIRSNIILRLEVS